MEYVLGLDIGTGSVKAVAVNTAGRSLEVCQRFYSFNAPRPGYHEQDPELIWNAFKECVIEMIGKTGTLPLGIGLSSAMHSLIAVDDNGHALAPMTTWADNRSVEIANQLKVTEAGLSIYEATGTPIHAMSPLCKLMWMQKNDTELFGKADKFISIKEYIWFRLFREFRIDHSVASGTGLFNILQLTWHTEALALAGITEQRLSAPVPTGYMRIYHAADGDPALNILGASVPFIIGASDGCLANLGSMANKAGMAAMTIGTSGAVRIASNTPLPNRKAMTFSYILDEQTFICGGPINNGGMALQWWLKNITASDITDEDYQRLFKQVESVQPGSNGLLFMPYLTGERAPVWDSESCGSFFGVKLEHRQAHFSRAVVEGICYAMKDVLDALEQRSAEVPLIHISGGLVRSQIWMQILANITGKTLMVVQTEDASAIGAALIAMKRIALIHEYPGYDPDNVKMIRPESPDNALYTRNVVIYKQLYSALKETMHQLYKLNN